MVPWGGIKEIIVVASFEIHSHDNQNLCFNTSGVSHAEPLHSTYVLHI